MTTKRNQLRPVGGAVTSPSAVPIRPEMRQILQTLANEVVGWRKNIADAQKRLSEAESGFQIYINQCAELLNLDPDTVVFSPERAEFTFKTGSGGPLPIETSAEPSDTPEETSGNA